MQLIELLLRNWPILLVVLGFLVSVLRKSPLEKPRRPGTPARPAGRMPDFGGGGFPRPQQREAEKPRRTVPDGPGPLTDGRAPQPETRPSASGFPAPPVYRLPDEAREDAGFPAPSASPPASASKARETGEGIGARAAAETYRRPGPGLASRSFTPQDGLTASVPEQGAIGGAPLTQDDLARAVMWAEILGPPRSRKPHRR
ncbi:hypothetical protein [Cohnella sp. REN36]|uniref:hypothetical protein n=1 Tax=Cohnella sp. REN36 TaxID=2887347 RepID=UPI001D153097|nr:hypothetical protein [Cohnella sp. REN36]MCC3372796.1 hypothetical protein [Cohnella sp. REN36]